MREYKNEEERRGEGRGNSSKEIVEKKEDREEVK